LEEGPFSLHPLTNMNTARRRRNPMVSGFIKHEDTETQGTEKKRINGL